MILASPSSSPAAITKVIATDSCDTSREREREKERERERGRKTRSRWERRCASAYNVAE